MNKKYFFQNPFIWAFIFIAGLVRLFVFEPVLVSNSEMLPTLLRNDYVLVKKYFYGLSLPFLKKNIFHYRLPQRGDVVLMKAPYSPHSLMIRRVIAVPGDRLFYSKGILYINEKTHRPQIPEFWVQKEKDFLKPLDFPGKIFEKPQEDFLRVLREQGGYEHWQESLPKGETYGVFLQKNASLSFGPYKIPKKHFFVMGDHRMFSRDSRTWPVQGSPAQGEIIFSRKSTDPRVNDHSKLDSNEQGLIVIPKGTKLTVKEDAYFPLFFETLHPAVLSRKTSSIKVGVTAQNIGLNGNVGLRAKWEIEGLLKHVLEARNERAFYGGRDQSLAPLHLIKGKAVLIAWGCEKPVEFLKFLCHFNSFRKGRWFWPVHKGSF